MSIQFTGDDLDRLALTAKSFALVHNGGEATDSQMRIRRKLLDFAEKAHELSIAMHQHNVDHIDFQPYDAYDQVQEVRP